MDKLIHIDIPTMMRTNRTGAGTANYQSIGDGFMEFVSGEPCAECVNAKFAKDRHSICEVMVDTKDVSRIG